jgi:hypothetical protein
MGSMLYGWTADPDTPVDAMSELAYDRKYWVEEHKLPFLIGIDTSHVLTASELTEKNATTNQGDGGGMATNRAFPPFLLDYKVGGYPTVYVLDRKGIVRGHFLGWDEKGVSRLVEKLLKEGAAGTQ